MIPQKLELKNFLCYGEDTQTIDFKNYNLICLSGKNGNGKSALLDAMTWALWGHARKITGTIKADEGLLRLGQTRMMVCFEFTLQEKQYRIRREYAKTYGKPYASLDFDIFNDSSKNFIALTDKTIKLTQAKIEQTIGLDFETFINSAFLKQGQSNKFSKKTPKERKHILATILGLSKYDKLQQHALELSKKQAEEKRVLTKLQEQAQLEIEKEHVVTAALSCEQKDNTKIIKLIDETQKKLSQKENEKQTWEKQKQAYDSLTQEIIRVTQKRTTKNTRLLELVKYWKRVHAQALKLPDIKKLEHKKWELIKQEQTFLELQKNSLSIKEKILHTQNMLAKHEQAIKNKLEKKLHELTLDREKKELILQNTCQTLEQKQKEVHEINKQEETFMHEHAKITQEQKQEKAFMQEFTRVKAQFDKRRVFYQTLIQRGNHVKTLIKELHDKKNITHDKTNPSCPLCQQVLTLKRKQYLNRQFKQQEVFLTHRLNRITKLIKKLKEILVTQHKDVQKLTKKSEHYAQLAIHVKELLKNQKQAMLERKSITQACQLLDPAKTKFEKEILEFTKKIDTHKQSTKSVLVQDKTIITYNQTLEKLIREKKACTYPEKEHKELAKEITQIDNDLKKIETIRHELDSQHKRKIEISQLCKELKDLKYTLIDLTDKQKKLSFDKTTYSTIEKAIETIAKELIEHRAQKDKILQKIGRLNNEIDRIALLKQERKKRIKVLKKITQEQEDYHAIAQAFSKDGLQALLIEEAIPEIEDEANNILGKLTNNQAQIFIESLRDLKRGGTKETLDIKIADTIGIRPYEMYSGGEAFRIDFALRIAISKLLARRAGTALQTLIIDEGFGSQDEDGLARLMNAIHAIQHDFAKVIIVSHLPEFKDHFPVHFLASKSATGSTITVEERG